MKARFYAVLVGLAIALLGLFVIIAGLVSPKRAYEALEEALFEELAKHPDAVMTKLRAAAIRNFVYEKAKL